MENNCPCCKNHCPQDDLRCPRGREYFGIRNESDRHPENPEEKTIVLLRKCGHFLHHNAGHDSNPARLLQALTEDERTTLESLLEKCLNNWHQPEN